MFGLFGGNKNKGGSNAKKTSVASNVSAPPKSRSPESIALRERVKKQISEKRAELGPEEIEKMRRALNIEKAKKSLKTAIDDEDRKQDVLHELREMIDKDKL